MPTSAPLASLLTIAPAAPAPAPTPAAPVAKSDDKGPSFSKMLADQKNASRQDAPGKKADAKPAEKSPDSKPKPAESQQDATPAAQADAQQPAEPVAGKDTAADATAPSDASAAQLAQAEAQAAAQAAAQAQVQTQAAPTLPIQALEIAAQSAALQSQSAARLAAQQAAAAAQAGAAAPAAAQQQGAGPANGTQPTAAQAAAASALQAATLPQQAAQAAQDALPAVKPAAPQENPFAALRQTIATARDPRAAGHTAGGQHAQGTQDALAQVPADPEAVAAPLPDFGSQLAGQQQDDGARARGDLTAFAAAALRPVAAQAPSGAAETRAAPPAPILDVQSPVGSSTWGRDIGRQLVLLGGDAQRGQHTAELRLDPPDLGPLRVTLSLSDGVATASFVSAHASVRQALESALPQLQQALAEAGISLGQADVGEQGNQFAQEQSPAGRQGNGQAGAGTDSQGETDAAQRVAVVRDANALVDTFA
ncbi:flagellar hook-length control protein FliK [Bordetella genomosp. 13]|uniref:flagellar hook-length control protein FliK n=1 Tax=Bordetella genomosp. 13 TaxID=463040 RepID=UPI00119FE143|nr:flagellar hook-length control protein FliK [Bordetella genomosp. 13]